MVSRLKPSGMTKHLQVSIPVDSGLLPPLTSRNYICCIEKKMELHKVVITVVKHFVNMSIKSIDIQYVDKVYRSLTTFFMSINSIVRTFNRSIKSIDRMNVDRE